MFPILKYSMQVWESTNNGTIYCTEHIVSNRLQKVAANLQAEISSNKLVNKQVYNKLANRKSKLNKLWLLCNITQDYVWFHRPHTYLRFEFAKTFNLQNPRFLVQVLILLFTEILGSIPDAAVLQVSIAHSALLLIFNYNIYMCKLVSAIKHQKIKSGKT